MSQLSADHTLTPDFHSYIILLSTFSSHKWSLPLKLPIKILYAYLISFRRVACPVRLLLLGLIAVIILREEYRYEFRIYVNFLSCYSQFLS